MEGEEPIDEERVKIRDELSQMTFEELENLKRKIGTKIFKQIAAGQADDDDKKHIYKRPSKNHPREISSKRKLIKVNNTTIKPAKIATVRDPRFDPLCGAYEEKSFKENYKFVNEIRKKEREDLHKEYESTTDEKNKKKIKYLMQRMDNKIKAEEIRQREKERKQMEVREIKDKLKHGQKPIFKKKSERKVEELMDKYEDLKKNNKVQKYIEKKAKKNRRIDINTHDT